MSGAEVIDGFQPSEDIALIAEQRVEALINALQQLASNLQIIRFDKEESPRDWGFRSRIAETVCLLGVATPADCV